MKTLMNRTVILVTIAVLAIMATSVSAVTTSTTVSVVPTQQTAIVNDSVLVDIAINGLGQNQAPSLGAFDFDLGYDANILAFNDVTFGDQLNDLADTGLFPSTQGFDSSVNVFEISWDLPSDLKNLQESDFTLATISFDAIAEGSSELVLSLNELSDSDANPLQATVEDGTVNVIPEPATLLLTLAGAAFVRTKLS